MIAEADTVEASARELLKLESDSLAIDYLTRYSHNQAMEGLRLGEALLASIEASTRVLFGLREPATDEMSRLDYRMV